MTLYIEQSIDLDVLCAKLSANLSFTLTETGGGAPGSGSVSIATGQHFLTVDGSVVEKPDPDDAPLDLEHTPLLTAIQDAINALALSATYAVTFDPVTERVAIAGDGAGGVTSFALTAMSSVAQRCLGYTSNKSGAGPHAADRAPYYWMKCSEGGLTDYFNNEEAESEIGEDLRSHGADVYGIDQDELPMRFDAVIPLEPRAKLWTDAASATVPWTWERFFRHARQMGPAAIAFDNGTVSWTKFVLLDKAGRRFAPRPRQSKNLWTYGDVPITAWLLGSL